MARPVLVNLLLVCCCAVVLRGIMATGDAEKGGADSHSSPTSSRHSRQSPADAFFNSVLSDDVQMNIIMNQLAIIKLLNETSTLSPGGGVRAVVEEMTHVREEVKAALDMHREALHQLTSLAMSETNRSSNCEPRVQNELARAKEQQASLRQELTKVKEELATLTAASREVEEEAAGFRNLLLRIRGDITALNTSLTQQVNEAKLKQEQLASSMGEELATLNATQMRLRATLTAITHPPATPKHTCQQTCGVEGELHVSDNCTLLECHDDCLHKYQVKRAISVTSWSLDGKCGHLFKASLTWREAREECQALGGDLFVTNNFQEAAQTIANLVSELHVDAWVGVKDTSWLDGRPVTSDEWAPGQPDNYNRCGFIRPHKKALRDAPCSSVGSFLCMTS